MNAIPSVDMAEVTRLTRAGRLAEATALLQGKAVAEPRRQKGRAAPGGPVIDMVPPKAGGAWTAEVGRSAAGQAEAGGGGPSSQFSERTFNGPAGSRAYKLFVPSGYRGQPLPLIVMLHGCTQSPDDFAAGTRMNERAEEAPAFVAYPAQSRAANSQRCWNWFNAAEQERGRGEPSLVEGITREVMRDFSIDARRVYVAGLSAGGAAAATMAMLYPDLYAGVGIHSGLACGAASDMMSAFAAMQGGAPATAPRPAGLPPVPTIVFHGDRDRTVNVANADHVIEQARGAAALTTLVTRGTSADGATYTRSVQSGRDGGPVLEQWTLHGAGHAWSGGSPAGSYTDPHGPDASREMLRFFAEHPGAREQV